MEFGLFAICHYAVAGQIVAWFPASLAKGSGRRTGMGNQANHTVPSTNYTISILIVKLVPRTTHNRNIFINRDNAPKSAGIHAHQ